MQIFTQFDLHMRICLTSADNFSIRSRFWVNNRLLISLRTFEGEVLLASINAWNFSIEVWRAITSTFTHHRSLQLQYVLDQFNFTPILIGPCQQVLKRKSFNYNQLSKLINNKLILITAWHIISACKNLNFRLTSACLSISQFLNIWVSKNRLKNDLITNESN